MSTAWSRVQLKGVLPLKGQSGGEPGDPERLGSVFFVCEKRFWLGFPRGKNSLKYGAKAKILEILGFFK